MFSELQQKWRAKDVSHQVLSSSHHSFTLVVFDLSLRIGGLSWSNSYDINVCAVRMLHLHLVIAYDWVDPFD